MPHLYSFYAGQVGYVHHAQFGEDDFVGFAVGSLAAIA